MRMAMMAERSMSLAAWTYFKAIDMSFEAIAIVRCGDGVEGNVVVFETRKCF